MNAITPIQDVRRSIRRLAPEFAKALPPGVSPERFERVCLTAIQQNEKLLECTQDSLWGACMRAAQDGLLPDGREGAIVPRWNGKRKCSEAHWMPMVAGLIAKAKRKGSVVSLSAQVVYEGEKFQVLLGDEDRIEHVRDIAKVQRGKEVAVYAIATLKDGSKEREVMSWQEVQQIANVSQRDKDGNIGAVWRTWEGEMARKSCIRRLSKRLPSLDEGDDELRRTIERVDELYDFDRPAAVAAPEPAAAIAHEQKEAVEVDTPSVNRMSSADLDAATRGDEIPEFDPPPKLDRLRKVADRIKQRLADSTDQDNYNAVMSHVGIAAEWDKIRTERPELAEELDLFRQDTLSRIAMGG